MKPKKPIIDKYQEAENLVAEKEKIELEQAEKKLFSYLEKWSKENPKYFWTIAGWFEGNLVEPGLKVNKLIKK